jgi:Electron transfer flavoprotein, alpha subunit
VSVLVVAEQLQGRVRDVTYELISAAQALGGPVTVAVIGSDPGAFDANRVDVDEVVHVQVEQPEFESDVYQAALERLIAERQPDVVLLGFTVNGMGYAGAVAAKLGLGFASDVFAVRARTARSSRPARSTARRCTPSSTSRPASPCCCCSARPCGRRRRAQARRR